MTRNTLSQRTLRAFCGTFAHYRNNAIVRYPRKSVEVHISEAPLMKEEVVRITIFIPELEHIDPSEIPSRIESFRVQASSIYQDCQCLVECRYREPKQKRRKMLRILQLLKIIKNHSRG